MGTRGSGTRYRIFPFSLSRFIVSSGARQRGMPRNFAMQMGCNWPTAVSDQFKGSFPGSAILHIRALRDKTRRARAVVMNRGTTHTPRNGRCVCILRLQFRIGLLIHSRAELRSRVAIPFHDSPRVSRLISLPLSTLPPWIENGN